MESLSREHAARFGQVPRLTWVMARAYAPKTPLLGVLWAAWSVPAYLLLVWLNWGAGTLVARADGRAVFTATRVGFSGRRGVVALVPLLVAYVAALAAVSSWLEGVADVGGARAGFSFQASSIVVMAAVMLLPVRPWTIGRNREAKAANSRARAEVAGPHWELEALAAWPPGHGYGTELIEQVLESSAAVGTGWLVARELWLVPIYSRLGWEVVEGSGGRGMTLKLGSRV